METPSGSRAQWLVHSFVVYTGMWMRILSDMRVLLELRKVVVRWYYRFSEAFRAAPPNTGRFAKSRSAS